MFTGDLQQLGNGFYWNYRFLSIEKGVHSLEAEELTWESRQRAKDKMLNFYWRCSQIFVLMDMCVVCMHASILIKVLVIMSANVHAHTRMWTWRPELTSGGFLDHSPLNILRQGLPLESTAS